MITKFMYCQIIHDMIKFSIEKLCDPHENFPPNIFALLLLFFFHAFLRIMIAPTSFYVLWWQSLRRCTQKYTKFSTRNIHNVRAANKSHYWKTHHLLLDHAAPATRDRFCNKFHFKFLPPLARFLHYFLRSRQPLSSRISPCRAHCALPAAYLRWNIIASEIATSPTHSILHTRVARGVFHYLSPKYAAYTYISYMR